RVADCRLPHAARSQYFALLARPTLQTQPFLATDWKRSLPCTIADRDGTEVSSCWESGFPTSVLTYPGCPTRCTDRAARSRRRLQQSRGLRSIAVPVHSSVPTAGPYGHPLRTPRTDHPVSGAHTLQSCALEGI